MSKPWVDFKKAPHGPDFNQFLKVLKRQVPDRPVLYELFMNGELYKDYCGFKLDWTDKKLALRAVVRAFVNLGYDHAAPWCPLLYDFTFSHKAQRMAKTISLNEGAVITDRKSFDAYEWPDPDQAEFTSDDFLMSELPAGMKLVPLGPGGVLENTISLVGYENLCLMLLDDPDLVRQIFDQVGSRLLRMYEILVRYKSIGAVVSNDDWGFKTQTMLAPDDMRKYVFPWHKKIVAAAHAAGKPVILHSCGKPDKIMDDVIDDIKMDARHSYEDNIVPVEQAYERWGSRIAIMGGLDMDFLCRSKPEEVYQRAKGMLERASKKGGYALGSGNSIPEYIPRESYLAMISAAWS